MVARANRPRSVCPDCLRMWTPPGKQTDELSGNVVIERCQVHQRLEHDLAEMIATSARLRAITKDDLAPRENKVLALPVQAVTLTTDDVFAVPPMAIPAVVTEWDRSAKTRQGMADALDLLWGEPVYTKARVYAATDEALTVRTFLPRPPTAMEILESWLHPIAASQSQHIGAAIH